MLRERDTYLHRHEPVIDHYLLRQEVGTNGGLILVAELLVHILVHQRRLADAVDQEATHKRNVDKREPKLKSAHRPTSCGYSVRIKVSRAPSFSETTATQSPVARCEKVCAVVG
ncbi:hypothetical protein BC938DRAFT_479821 [Jimgerdemannia flammicorona]|uniref:Uncharacterized protein n=1 Tax=Jimgerdemannia flammicorona TaxID=994334 RepID=A0A433QK06_9FUNG|nr:hypothetical protein BC938DRAFT_479821 [Jimgerdemannia flammicorona]